MKKILYFSLLLLITSCDCMNYPNKTNSELSTDELDLWLSKAKSPIIIFAVAKATDDADGSIVFKDADGNMFTGMSNEATANAFIESYKVGDTIK